MKYLPDQEYRKIINSMPIFCIDFLITWEKQYLLLQRKEEPLKNDYWVVGGRLLFKETIKDAAKELGERNWEIFFKV